jgi:hypothetical protein
MTLNNTITVTEGRKRTIVFIKHITAISECNCSGYYNSVIKLVSGDEILCLETVENICMAIKCATP